MKKILFFLIALIPFAANSQKQGNIWYFGVTSGLDFSGGTPSLLYDGWTGVDAGGIEQEGTSCISDNFGNLLFYTGGQTIWNRFHNPMPNGLGLMGGVSSTQSSLIVPLPGNDSIFYLFTSDMFQHYTSPPHHGYRYNIVNICLDGGKGDIIAGQKNILLLDSATEKLAACLDAAGSGYWIMGHKMFSDKFYAWHLTSGGITDTVISGTGTVHGLLGNGNWEHEAAQGQMKFNPQGTKLALAISNFDPAIIDLFDFDSNTGLLSNACHMVIDSALGKRIYGVEFSPDGTKLYGGVAGGTNEKRVYQFDVTAGGGNCNSVIASRFTLFQSSYNSIMKGMQLAPDNKIYLVCNSNFDLGRINFPDLAGMAADFDSLAIVISGFNEYTLPSFIAGYHYLNGTPNCPASVGIENAGPGKAPVFSNLVTDVVHFTNTCVYKDYRIFDTIGKQVLKGEL
ncbi:MAG TPA: hypothetical protein VJY62_00235, partial [Bacteroidia bacterium]|nr:hypothetical protein [Bacteroidia bacterium]